MVAVSVQHPTGAAPAAVRRTVPDGPTPASTCASSARATSAGRRSASRCCAPRSPTPGSTTGSGCPAPAPATGTSGGARTTARVRVLRTAGYPEHDHRARQITRAELADVDLVLAADRGHLRDLRAMTTDHDKVVLLRSLRPGRGRRRGARSVLRPRLRVRRGAGDDEAAAPGIVEEIRRRLRIPAGVTNHPARRHRRARPRAPPPSRPTAPALGASCSARAGSRSSWPRLAFAAACFLLLSPWQFDRNTERSAQNAAIDASITAPAVPVDRPDVDHRPSRRGDVAWRVVTATGEFDPTRQVHVRLRQDPPATRCPR